MKKSILLGCWMVILASAGFAQQNRLAFERLSLEQGLSQSSVFCVFQDSRGFMWFGTEDGLNRYDGYTFKIYKHEPGNPRSLGGNIVYTVYEDRQGTLWVGTEGGGLNAFDRATETFTRYRHDPKDPASISHDGVYALLEDRKGNFWAGTYGGGLNRLDRKTGRFTRFVHRDDQPGSLGHDLVQAILEDKDGNLWVGTEGGGLDRFDPATGQFAHFRHQPGNPNSLGIDNVHALYQDKAGAIWIATEGGGLDRFEPDTKTFTHYRPEPGNARSLSHRNVTAVLEDPDGALWVGTYGGGLDRLDRQKNEFIHCRNAANDPASLSNDLVSSLLLDKSGTLWVATFSGGVNKVVRTKPFVHYQHEDGNPNSLSHNTVYAVAEDKNGHLWVGTEGGGLDRIDRRTGTYTHYRNRPGSPGSLSNDFVIALLEDRDGVLWAGTDSGLDRFNPATGTFTHYTHDPADPRSLSNPFVQVIHEGRSGNLWVGTEGGLNLFDRTTGAATRYLHEPGNPKSLPENSIYALLEDRNGVLWAGTDGGGLAQFDAATRSFTTYQHDPEDPASLVNNYAISLLEDKAGNLWVGTMGGLNRLDRATGKFTAFTEKNGLPNAVVAGILEDAEGNLWLSTNRGLAKFDPKRNTFKNYDYRDGLQSNEFNSWAYHKSRSGEMFFGGINGLNAFFPEQISDNPYQPPVVLTDFKIFNQSVPVGAPADSGAHRTFLTRYIGETKEVRLSYADNVFSLEFAALDFTRPDKNRYAYKLEGFEDDWVRAGNRRFVTYTNMDPGEYIFRVKAANNDGVWNEHGTWLRIVVTPPWWRTWWAYAGYGLLFVGVLYLVRQYTMSRERMRNRLQLKQLESDKLQEMDRMKTRFFTNISHEFRTPLTLILGPLEGRINAGGGYTPDPAEDRIMYRNARRLLQLVNQLLDLSKLESGSARLQAVQGDMVPFVRTLVSAFSSLAESRHIELSFEADPPALPAFFDKDKLEKVVSNLLSNAFKFTPEGGRIQVKLGAEAAGGWAVIAVRDSGIGIPADRVGRIFDRFYQVDGSHTREQEGTGIGLALTRELVTLHHGTIEVQSEVGAGTLFTVRLPREKAQYRAGEVIEVLEADEAFLPAGHQRLLLEDAEGAEEEPKADAYDHLPLILVVEDNADLRHYMRSHFGAGYRVMEANDGQAGLERAIEAVPDLVISDLMMPRMDGLELCRRLKTDERTSHIPVILLTARATGDSRVEGLETGADDYLTKPFNPKELQVRVRNLIEGRQKLRQRFGREVKLQPTDIAITSADEKFLQRAIATVEAHLGDPDFSVERFEEAMTMSKLQLYRKLKGLTNQSPSEFIRNLRLKRAAALLAGRSGSVAEITYEVGFNNLSYFAKCFRAVYGVSPSEYANSAEAVEK